MTAMLLACREETAAVPSYAEPSAERPSEAKPPPAAETPDAAVPAKPTVPSVTMRLAVISDLNSEYGSLTYESSVHASVKALVERIHPDLVLITGDMVAGQKPLASALDYDGMWASFHGIVTDALRAARIPVAPTPGNHDASAFAGFAHERATYKAEWSTPTRRPPLSFVDDSQFPFRYSFEQQGALFISLDATVPGPLSAEQLAWLTATLEASAKYPVKIVFGHLPIHPVAIGRETEVLADGALEALLAAHGVTLFVSGHHHAYYPGRAGGLRQLAMPCAGAGPRRLIETTAPTPQGLAVVDIEKNEIKALETLEAPSFTSPVARTRLPEYVAFDGHVVVRDDLDPQKVQSPKPPTLPIQGTIRTLPFSVRGSTAQAPASAIGAYSCAPNSDERGPEHIYRLDLAAPTTVRAWIHESAPADVDVHLLTGLALGQGVAVNCAARGNRLAQATLPAGSHYVVVDTFGGSQNAGDYALFVDAVDGAWHERPLAKGVKLRWRRFLDAAGLNQTTHVLDVDPKVPGVSIQAIAAEGCETVASIGQRVGAVAGVNAGYFGASCSALSLQKHAGLTTSFNARTRGAFGIGPMGPLIATVVAGADWPAAQEAAGGGPLLLTSGAKSTLTDWASEGFAGSFLNAAPRTVAAVTGSGHVLLGTFDGRDPKISGMSMQALLDTVSGVDFGAVSAVNLDGGGSTTMWVSSAPTGGVLNHPSDGVPRAVSNGLFVFAPSL
jgi:acid phosphatase type 7